MKDKKVLAHSELVNEVIRQLMGRFTPTPAVIKQRIENLIDVGRAFCLSRRLPDHLRFVSESILKGPKTCGLTTIWYVNPAL